MAESNPSVNPQGGVSGDPIHTANKVVHTMEMNSKAKCVTYDSSNRVYIRESIS